MTTLGGSSTLDETTATWLMNVYFFLLGFSLGLIIQVPVIAVQNTAPYEDLGAATSGVTFFRTIGGSFGVSVFGAIFANRLASQLGAALTGKQLPKGFSAASVQSSSSQLHALPADLRDAILHAYSLALHPVFLTAVPIAGAAFVLAWFLREVPLRTAAGEPSPAGETLRGSASAADLGEGLGGACWILTMLAKQGATPGPELARQAGVTMEEGHLNAQVLVDRGLITRTDGVLALAPAGAQTADRLFAAEHDWLEHQLAGWSPEQHAEPEHALARACFRYCGPYASNRAADGPRSH